MTFTEKDVHKLRAMQALTSPVLSLYLHVPLEIPALRSLPAQANDLLAVAMTDLDRSTAAQARKASSTVRRLVESNASRWLGHTVAIFACDELGLAEGLPLPCAMPERAVLASRPHVRPLLTALRWCPDYYVAVVDQQHAWLFRLTAARIEMLASRTAPGVRSPRFGGWYGLESHRVSDRITELARHHYRDTAAIMEEAAADSGRQPVVVGGHKDTIGAFVALLPHDLRDRVAGSFAVDTHTMTPARVRELSSPVIKDWVSRRDSDAVARVLAERPGGLAAVGLNSCLAAASHHLIKVLLIPVGDLVPGFACHACGALGTAPPHCPHGQAAVSPVPDIFEELAFATLDHGGDVAAVPDPPGEAAALLYRPMPRARNSSATSGSG